MAVELDLDIHLQGTPISPGLGQGQAYFPNLLLDAAVKPRQVGVGGTAFSPALSTPQSAYLPRLDRGIQEQSRLFTALKATQTELLNLKLDTYNAILQSPSLQTKTLEFINLGYEAESALKKVIDYYKISFNQIANIYLKSRLVDITDVIERIIFHLQKAILQSSNAYPHSLILILKTPSIINLLNIPRNYLKGIICFEGSSHSHMAILARSLGIPTIFGMNLKADLEELLDCRFILMDGTTGKICISQTQPQCLVDSQSAYVPQLGSEGSSLFSNEIGHSPNAYLPRLDRGIQEILELNSDAYSTIKQDLAQGAKSIGLYRSEVAFMLHNTFPTEEQLYNEYNLLLKSAFPHTVNIRILDIGADKSLSYFKPISDQRGLALMLAHPQIFEIQLRAMFRANIDLNNLRILLPMVLSVAQLEQALEFIQNIYNTLAKKYNILFPKIGAMIEALSAVDEIEEITQKVDFLSVGSNDLIYSILGLDRKRDHITLGEGLDPRVLQILNIVVKTAHQYHKKVSICGEMAGDALMSIVLLGLNFDTLSMDSRHLVKIKSILCQISKKDANKWVADVLAMDTAAQLREYLTQVLPISF